MRGRPRARRAGEQPCMPVLVLGVAWGQRSFHSGLLLGVPSRRAGAKRACAALVHSGGRQPAPMERPPPSTATQGQDHPPLDNSRTTPLLQFLSRQSQSLGAKCKVLQSLLN